METNILYYGNNIKINDIIIKEQGRKRKQYNGGIIYWETKTSFIFQSSPSTTVIETIKKLISTYNVVNNRHIVVILNIDKMGQENSRALRVILEKFYKTTRFIATTLHITAIDQTIKSRFHLQRVECEKQNLLFKNIIYKKEWKSIQSVADIKNIAVRIKEHTIADIAKSIFNMIPNEDNRRDFIGKAVRIEERYHYVCKNEIDKLCFIELLLVEGSLQKIVKK